MVFAAFRTIFDTDKAAGKVKLVVGMSGTLSFLYHLGLIYDSFGITCKGSTPMQMTPELVVLNVPKVHQYVQSTVRKVKESNQLKKMHRQMVLKELFPKKRRPQLSFC